MKKIIVAASVALMAVAAQADFYVNFVSTFGIYDNSGAAGLLGNVGDTATVELLYVGDNGNFDTLAGTGVFGDITPGGVGDDVLLWTGTFLNSGGLFEDYAAGTFGTAIAPYLGTGQMFARIWNQDDASVGGPWYYQGAIQVAANINPGAIPPPTPELYDLGGGADGQAATMGQVIPEPATFGLMGIAGIGMFLARRKARR